MQTQFLKEVAVYSIPINKRIWLPNLLACFQIDIAVNFFKWQSAAKHKPVNVGYHLILDEFALTVKEEE